MMVAIGWKGAAGVWYQPCCTAHFESAAWLSKVQHPVLVDPSWTPPENRSAGLKLVCVTAPVNAKVTGPAPAWLGPTSVAIRSSKGYRFITECCDSVFIPTCRCRRSCRPRHDNGLR